MVRGRVARRRVLLAMSSSAVSSLDFLTRRPWASARVLAHTTWLVHDSNLADVDGGAAAFHSGCIRSMS